MNNDELREISRAADALGIINKAIATLQHGDRLYIVTDYSLNVRFNVDDAIVIPKDLLEEFKQKLLAYYAKRYNEIINELKPIDYGSETDRTNV